MNKMKFTLLLAFLLTISLSLKAQEQKKINFNLFLTEAHINTELKERFVARIKKSNSVKDID